MNDINNQTNLSSDSNDSNDPNQSGDEGNFQAQPPMPEPLNSTTPPEPPTTQNLPQAPVEASPAATDAPQPETQPTLSAPDSGVTGQIYSSPMDQEQAMEQELPQEQVPPPPPQFPQQNAAGQAPPEQIPSQEAAPGMEQAPNAQGTKPGAGEGAQMPQGDDSQGTMISQEPSPAGGQGQVYQAAPQKSSATKWAIVFIIIILVLSLGGLGYAYFSGKLSLPFLDKLLKRNQTAQVPTLPESTTNNTNTNDQQRKSDLTSIKNALAEYKQEKNTYPATGDKMEKTNDPNSILVKALVPKYLDKMPLDPLDPDSYYGYKSDGKTYRLSAVLENQNDTDAQKQGNLFLYIITG